MHRFKETADLSIQFNNLQLIDSKKSKFYNINVYKHSSLGRILVLNKEVQHVEKWAPLYHEMVVHLPAAFIPHIQKVLILGGGSLFAAKEVLKYNSVEKVVMIDHDANVINIMKDNYPHAKNVVDDKRFELRIQDAFDGIQTDYDAYDLVINDSVDLINHGRSLRSNILRSMCKKLAINGICSDVVYRHIFERKLTLETLKLLKGKFKSTFSLIAVPEYPGIFHVLCLWSNSNYYLKGKILVNHEQKKWLKRKYVPCDYYNPQYLNYYKYFPNYLNKILNNI